MQYFTLSDLKNQKDKIQWHILEIMQFTGLKDKNGKEIYEGDIVRCIHEEGMSWSKIYIEIGEVVFSRGGFGVKCPKKGCENAKDVSKRTFFLNFNIKRDFEIIGNVHQNHELLKGVTDGK